MLLLVATQAASYACNAHPAIHTANRCFICDKTSSSRCHVAVSMLHGKKQAVLVQGGTTAMYTFDHDGDERQLSLFVGQWPHHGAVAGTPHLSLLHAAGAAAPSFMSYFSIMQKPSPLVPKSPSMLLTCMEQRDKCPLAGCNALLALTGPSFLVM